MSEVDPRAEELAKQWEGFIGKVYDDQDLMWLIDNINDLCDTRAREAVEGRVVVNYGVIPRRLREEYEDGVRDGRKKALEDAIRITQNICSGEAPPECHCPALFRLRAELRKIDEQPETSGP